MLPAALCFLFAFALIQIAVAQLPPYSGPFSVGLVDIEIPVQARNISQGIVNTTGQPAFELETVLFSLYYPAEPGVNSTKPQHPWLPPPTDLIGQGFAEYAESSGVDIDPQTLTAALKAIAGKILVPAQVDVPLASGNASYPVLVFSHGDAGLRTFYSHLVGELASRGCVVAAIEHRDGSGPGTVELKKDGFVRNVTYFTANNISPPISNDTFTFAQRDFRQAEVEETINVLRNISNGGGSDIYNENPRNEGQNLVGFQNRLDFNQLLIGGHSLGATLALQTLEPNVTSAIPAKAAILFDPGKDSGPLNTDVNVPLLIADSQGWSQTPTQFYGQPHFDVVKSAAETALNRTGAGWFMTLLGTAHGSITDAAIIDAGLLPYFAPGYNATIDPNVGLAQYVSVSAEFVARVQNATTTGVLAAPVTDPEFNVSANSSEARGVPSDISQYWQIHVAPANSTASSTASGPAATSSHKSSARRLVSRTALIVIAFVVVDLML